MALLNRNDQSSTARFRHAHRYLLQGFLLLAWLLSLGLREAGAAVPFAQPGEHEVKAAALYNIIRFVEWPPAAFEAPDTPFVIGLVGSGPVATLLEALAENESWRGHRIMVLQNPRPADLARCHVLYVAQSGHGAWRGLASRLNGRPVLTASDAPDFALRGGMVQFSIERNRLRLSINLGATREANLTVSSTVLRLATIVGAEP